VAVRRDGAGSGCGRRERLWTRQRQSAAFDELDALDALLAAGVDDALSFDDDDDGDPFDEDEPSDADAVLRLSVR
jgi:hypothetical protein